MQKLFRVTVDISKKIPAPAFEVNTNDLKSVKLEITITNGQSLLDLTDVTPRINIRKPDNEVIFQDCEIVDAKAGKVQIVLENQAYLVPGTHTAEIACYKGNEITAITGTFSYKSVKGIMNDEAVESKSEFTAIDRKIEAARKLLEDIGENGVGVDEQARQKIEEVTTQLADITQFELVADVEETAYKTGNSTDYNYMRSRQIDLLGKFYRNLRKGTPIQICCIGDSLTYGQDTVSTDKRPADANVAPDGSRHTNTRASVTYPEALQEYLRGVYGSDKVTVINRGFSGDWVAASYAKWRTKHTSDLTIMMFGTNDSRAAWVPSEYKGNISEYIKWYEQIIIREILWGKAIIILTPPKLAKANDVDIDTYSKALKVLGEKYSIPVIDSTEFTANYSASIYCDGIHFNGRGYRIFGAKVASLFIGSGAHKPQYVRSGVSLLTRPMVDNVHLMNGANFSGNAAYPTPDEFTEGQGIGAYMANDGSALIYSVYAETGDLLIVPELFSDNASITYDVELDFGVEQPDFTFVFNHGYTSANHNAKPTGKLTLQRADFTNNFYGYSFLNSLDSKYLIAATKGWHTVKITVRKTSGNPTIYGLNFVDYEVFRNKMNSYTVSGISFLTHNSLSDTTSVTTSTIDMQNMLSKFGWTYHHNEYWRNRPFKVTVFNWEQNILEYIIQPGGLTGSETLYKVGLDVKETKLKTTPESSAVRTLSGVTYDKTNKILTLNWAGATSRATNITVSPI